MTRRGHGGGHWVGPVVRVACGDRRVGRGAGARHLSGASAAEPSPPRAARAAASRRVSHSRRGDVFSVGICERYLHLARCAACLPPERLLPLL